LIETASETPRAAAEVISHLRREISNNIERDNGLLEERQRMMEELNTLIGSLEQSSTGQREAVEMLIDSSSNMLKNVGSQFTDHVGSEVTKLSGIAESLAGSATEIADNFAGSAVEMSSLGEAFGFAVQLFNESNSALIENLTRIESSLENSSSRSDEQLGYYVAQARDIIDHSLMAQKEIFEELRQLSQESKDKTEQALLNKAKLNESTSNESKSSEATPESPDIDVKAIAAEVDVVEKGADKNEADKKSIEKKRTKKKESKKDFGKKDVVKDVVNTDIVDKGSVEKVVEKTVEKPVKKTSAQKGVEQVESDKTESKEQNIVQESDVVKADSVEEVG